MMVVKITSTNFEEEVIKSDMPVLLDFYADWCGPCKMMGPIVEELAGVYGSKVKVGKINVDENSDVAAKYGVMSIPTLIMFKKGEVLEKSIGLKQKDELIKMIDKSL